MKNFKLVFIAFFFILGLNYVSTGNSLVLADDHFEEKYEIHGDDDGGDDGPYEDIGKTIGWGTVMTMAAAGVIFPIRRSMKWAIKNFPAAKSMFITISKFFGKYHIFIGIIALALGILHGAAMYLSEGELESEGILGLGAAVLMVIAAVTGALLYKKRKAKSLRNIHITLMVFAILIGFIHVFSS